MGTLDFMDNQQGATKEREIVLFYKNVFSPHSPLPRAIMVEQNDTGYSLG